MINATMIITVIIIHRALGYYQKYKYYVRLLTYQQL